MRSKTIAWVLGTACFTTPAYADETDTHPKNIVFADLGLHVIGAGFQRTISSKIALSASLNFYDAWTATEKVGDVRGIVLRLRPYFFLTEDAPRGLWVSPFIQGGLARGQREVGTKDGSAAAIGASVGYAFLFWRNMHLSLGAGGQYHVAYIPPDSSSPSFHKLHVHADITLGYGF